MIVNWHRIFHGFTANWKDTGCYTEWVYERQIRGQYAPGGVRYGWIRKLEQVCSWCGKTRMHYDQWYRDLWAATSKKEPPWQ